MTHEKCTTYKLPKYPLGLSLGDKCSYDWVTKYHEPPSNPKPETPQPSLSTMNLQVGQLARAAWVTLALGHLGCALNPKLYMKPQNSGFSTSGLRDLTALRGKDFVGTTSCDPTIPMPALRNSTKQYEVTIERLSSGVL